MRIPANNAVCPRRRNKLLEIRGTIVVIRAKKQQASGVCFLLIKTQTKKAPVFSKKAYFCRIKTARMEQDANLYGLNQRLFWDIDPRNFNIDESAAWIIQRVLEYGTMKDWNILENHFGIDKIVSYAQTLRTLDPVALSFLCFLSGQSKESFLCYRLAQSNPTPWNS